MFLDRYILRWWQKKSNDRTRCPVAAMIVSIAHGAGITKNKIDPAFSIYTTVLPSRHLYTAPRGPRLRSQTHPYTSYKLDLYMTSILCACSACWSSSLFYIMRIISLTQSKWLDRSYVRGGNRNTGQAAGVLRVVAVYTW
jgi:hypothetical protein